MGKTPNGYHPVEMKGSSGNPGAHAISNANALNTQQSGMINQLTGGKILAPVVPTPSHGSPGGESQTSNHVNSKVNEHTMQAHSNAEYDGMVGKGGSKKRKHKKRTFKRKKSLKPKKKKILKSKKRIILRKKKTLKKKNYQNKSKKVIHGGVFGGNDIIVLRREIERLVPTCTADEKESIFNTINNSYSHHNINTIPIYVNKILTSNPEATNIEKYNLLLRSLIIADSNRVADGRIDSWFNESDNPEEFDNATIKEPGSDSEYSDF